MRIAHEQLRLSAKLGAGSQGAIYRVDGGVDAFPFPLIYKEFAASTVVSGAALEGLTAFRDGLPDADRRVLDLRTVWPVAVVTKGNRVVGYLMQQIPPEYFQTIQTMAGGDAIPREVQHLFVADELGRKNLGEAPTAVERLAIARQTAFVLGFLHRRELVFGDLSYKNAVYTLRPRPMVVLLDCDAVRRRGQGAAVAQLNSPGWGAPEKGPQTIESDRYKLGLFVLRCLTPGVNAQNRDPAKAAGVLDSEGRALLARSLGTDPAARPSGKDWVTYLDGRIEAAGGVTARSTPPAKPAAPPRIERASAHPDARRPGRRTAPWPGTHVAPPAGVGPGVGGRSRVGAWSPSGAAGAGAPAVPRGASATARPVAAPTAAWGPAGPVTKPPATWVARNPGAGWTGSGWIGATGAPGAPAPAPVPNKWSTGESALVIAWSIVAVLVAAAFVFAPRSSSSTSSTALPSGGTTGAAAVSTALSTDAQRAVGAVAGVAPSETPVRIWSGTSATPLGSAGAGTLDRAPAAWVVATSDPATVVPGGASPVNLRVVHGDLTIDPPVATSMPLGGSVGDGNGPVALSSSLASSLNAAVTSMRAGHRADYPTSVAYLCSPTASSATDCNWVFAQFDGAGTRSSLTFVSSDGSRVVAEPLWYTG